MNSNELKLNIMCLATQMNDLTDDLLYIINAMEEKQITKKEVRKSLKRLIKYHTSKTNKLNTLLKNYLNDTTY